MTDPKWHSSDLPRAGEAAIEVEHVAPAETIERARKLCEDIVQAMLAQQQWSYLVESALIEERLSVEHDYVLRQAIAESGLIEDAESGLIEDASEVPTLIPQPSPTPSIDTGYSQVSEEEIEVVFDLFDGVEPSDPPSGATPIVPKPRKI